MNKLQFTRLAKFYFDNNCYQMYMTSNDKIAFLRLTADGKLHYPSSQEFVNLIYFFSNKYDDKKKNFKNGNHKQYRFIPRITLTINKKVVLVALTSSLVMSILSGCGANANEGRNYYYEAEEYSPIITNTQNESTTANYQEEDNDIIDNKDIYANLITKRVELYNDKYFNELFGEESISLESMINKVQNIKHLPNEYKEFISSYIYTLYNYYPNLEFRVFFENLKTLNLELRNEGDMCFLDGSIAQYDFETNTLILRKNMDLENDPKSKMIVRHELWHMFNNINLTKNGYDIEYHFNVAGRGLYLSEALDVIYSTAPFIDEYPEDVKENMGYPITSNIVRVLLESMNYTAQDSISSNVYKFQNSLGEILPNDIDPKIIEELIELQWMEYETGQIQLDADDYKDLFGYIARVHIKKNLSPNMSYEDVVSRKEELINKLKLGLKDSSYIHENFIEQEFMEYMQLNNIKETTKHR